MTDPSNEPDSPDPSKPRCTARTSRGACRRWPVKGATVCATHGGRAPQVRAAADRRLATAEWARSFGQQITDADPTETVLNEIRWSAGHVAWLRDQVADTTTEDLQESRWLTLYGVERDRLVRMCEVAHRMGISERQIELAERLGQLMADLLSDVLDELHLTADQQQAAAAAVPRHLRALAGELTGEAS